MAKWKYPQPGDRMVVLYNTDDLLRKAYRLGALVQPVQTAQPRRSTSRRPTMAPVPRSCLATVLKVDMGIFGGPTVQHANGKLEELNWGDNRWVK